MVERIRRTRWGLGWLRLRRDESGADESCHKKSLRDRQTTVSLQREVTLPDRIAHGNLLSGRMRTEGRFADDAPYVLD